MKLRSLTKPAGIVVALYCVWSPSLHAAGCERGVQDNEAIATFCSAVASDMRVKLYALNSLREQKATRAAKAIRILEHSVYRDRLSLQAFHKRKVCQTRNVLDAMDDATQYLSKNPQRGDPEK